MTNPIKKLFEIIKAIVTFPISLIQVRKAMQEMEKFQRLYDNPEEQKKILAKMGISADEVPFFNPIFQQMMQDEVSSEVDLAYLDELEEEEPIGEEEEEPEN